MSEPFIAEIKMFAGNYAPKGYAMCLGQLLPFSQNQAIAALIGNTYGGSMPNTVALPHFGGVSPIATGTSPGIATPFVVGNKGGQKAVTLTNDNLPPHTHTLNATTQPGTSHLPTTTSVLATAMDATGTPLNIYGKFGNADTPMDTQMSPQAFGNSGSSVPVAVQNPYLTVSFIIALTGIFPTRG